ncbi:MAG: c-type cytochrome [Terriglobales bacterium]
MLKFWLGFAAGIGALIGLAALSAAAGWIPVATSSHPLPMETWLAKTALHAKLRAAAAARSPLPASTANLQEGARIFKNNCAVCHGMPNHPKTAIAAGMFPSPPQLWTLQGMVTDDPIGVTQWKVNHGIRLTGMPGFSGSLTTAQIWQVSLLLKNAQRLPPAARAELLSSGPATMGVVSGYGAGH